MTTPDITIDNLPRPAPDAPTPPTAPPPVTPQAAEDDPQRRRKLIILLILGLILIALLLFSAWYLLFRKPISEIIPPTENFAMPTFVAAMYEVATPIDVAVSPDGSRIYVTQGAGTQETLVLDASGKQLGTLAPPLDEGARATQMFIAVDPGSGDVYTTDRAASVVSVYAGDGTFKRFLEPTAEMGAWQPLAITVDADGNVFVADVAPPFTRVHEFTRDGTFVRDFGAPDQLDHPNGLAVDSKGNLYVSSTGTGSILVFDPTGERRAAVARGPGAENVGLPRGLAIDDKDRVYVADSTGQHVQVYRALGDGDSTLEYVDEFGQGGTGDGAFAFPNGVAVDARSRIYIADWDNDRIQLWSY
jgi:DNA-binding beta-propeller fold protein YncE